MIHGERVRMARERLGMDRMTFAISINTTQSYIANIENCKDDSKWLSSRKMQTIIDMARLPKGYFFYTAEEFNEIVMENKYDFGEVFAKFMNDANHTITDKDLAGVAEILKRLKDKT